MNELKDTGKKKKKKKKKKKEIYKHQQLQANYRPIIGL